MTSDNNWIDVAPCGYLSFKDDGSIVYVNQTLAKWLGYNAENLIGKKVEQIFTIATRIFYNTHFFPLLKLHAKAEEIFLALRTIDKKEIPVLASAERRTYDDEHLNHCVLLSIFHRQKFEQEILAARHKAEDALKENKHLQELRSSLEARTLELEVQIQSQANLHKNLTQFSKIVSHDLQEPIRKISLFVEMLLDQIGNEMPHKAAKNVEKITRAVTRLKTVATGLQQYLGVESDPVHSHVDLNAVFESAKNRAMLHRKIEKLDLCYPSLPVIEGYQTQLELMFYHLIDNAIQFSDPDRPLRVEITSVLLDENLYKFEHEKYLFVEHVRIDVSDNGIGFEIDYKDYVTGLLNKLNPSTEGLGVGLSIIKKVVDNHSGTLTIRMRERHGTTFSILLPVKLFGI